MPISNTITLSAASAPSNVDLLRWLRWLFFPPLPLLPLLHSTAPNWYPVGWNIALKNGGEEAEWAMAMTYTQLHKQNTVIVVLEKKKTTETLEHVHLRVSNMTVMFMYSPH